MLKELMDKRYSVRDFSDKDVPDDVLREIICSVISAPSANNGQPYSIYVIKSDDAIERVRKVTPCAFNAPVVLLFCSKKSEAWVNPYNDWTSEEMDLSIAATYAMLKASDLGLGSTWVCWFDPALMKSELKIREDETPCCILPLGYPGAHSTPSKTHFKRKTHEEVIRYI